MPAVALAFQGLLQPRPLGRLDEADARSLAEVLNARHSPHCLSAARRILAAANRARNDSETTEDVVLSRDELEHVELACAEEQALQQWPGCKRLCDKVARMAAGL